jgi:hypothetical protein
VPIEPAAAATLCEWANARGAAADDIRPPWAVTGDAIAALEAVDSIHRDGSWFAWRRATEALADGDSPRLAVEISRLERP